MLKKDELNKIEEKLIKKDLQKLKKSMKVSGKSVFRLVRIIKSKSKTKTNK